MAEATEQHEQQGTEEHQEGDGRSAENLQAELDRRRRKQEKAERELQEMRDKLLEFEDRDKTEVERAKARAERAEQQLAELSNTVTGLQKGAWVRSAAAELNFHDPEDAVSHLRDKLSGFEDERDASRAVKALAKSKKHLVREEKDNKPERPTVGQMFAGQGTPNQPGNQQQPQNPYQAQAQRELEFAQGLAAQLQSFRENKWAELG